VTVVSILALPVRAGAEEELVGLFSELEVFERSRESGGFLGGRLLRPLDGAGIVVVAEWETAEAYRGWLDNPVRAELGERLQELMTDEVTHGKLYEEV
jgi:heme-degrading monooxygenase HmoA